MGLNNETSKPSSLSRSSKNSHQSIRMNRISKQSNSNQSKIDDNSSEKNIEKWLLASYDPDASIYTISSNISLANLNHNGDYSLLIGDIALEQKSSKLKVFHGTNLQSEHLLVDIPCGIVTVYNDTPELTSSVIVASSSFLYVYRNMKPFYKFSLPPLKTNQIESDVWNRFDEKKIDSDALFEILNNLRSEIGINPLTSRTLTFLNLPLELRNEFAEHYRSEELKKLDVITCMALLKKTVSDTNSASCLVLGTENRTVLILEIEAFTILATANLPSVPVFIQTNGLFDVEYKLLFACRDAHVYLIKRGYTVGRLCIQLNSQPVGLIRMSNNNIYIGTMDGTLSIYTNKGNRIWNQKQPSKITVMEEIALERQGLNLLAVALTNKTIRFYNDRKCVDVLSINDIVVAMKFGRYGREDNTLVMITKNGSLIVKILKRKATFQELKEEKFLNPTKLIIPKKTKLFVDQTMREREQFLTIHKTFEQELLRLKLNTYKTYAKAFKSSLNPISFRNLDYLKLSAKVIGLGPVFQIQMELQNNNVDNYLRNLLMIFDYDRRIYQTKMNTIEIGCLVPNLIYKFQNHFKCISELNVADTVKIYISHEKEESPLLTVIINMPQSELSNEPQ
ncbi:lysine-specific demethylase 8 [Sarcoptes scabiei]|nr:lysine-specific demethylase 8 [Sarcoptes scabiei]